MATPTIDATGAGPQANSYISLDQADAYFSAGLEDQRWLAFTPDERTRALIAATRQIDALRLWGEPYLASQALAFPRSSAPYVTVFYQAVSAEHDTAVALGHNPIIDATLVVSDDDEGTTTYTEETDYTIDYDAGTITVLATGDIADGATIYVSYCYIGPPVSVQNATAEQALWLLEQRANPELLDRAALQAQGVRAVGLDGISESYVAAGDEGRFSPTAWRLLAGYVQRVGRIGY